MHFGRTDTARPGRELRALFGCRCLRRSVSVAKGTSHFSVDKPNSKEIQMTFDVPDFNNLWKIQLEDHYRKTGHPGVGREVRHWQQRGLAEVIFQPA
jgi:hypothetical protein